MKKWYLSFVDEGGFKGACVVEADSLGEAIRSAWAHECNPGGEVLGIPFDKEIGLPLYRLMSRAELETYGPVQRKGDMEHPPQRIGLN
jgi:hypothetical protein